MERPLALKADYVEATISPTCSTMRTRATVRRAWRAGRSNSIRASLAPVSISLRRTVRHGIVVHCMCRRSHFLRASARARDCPGR